MAYNLHFWFIICMQNSTYHSVNLLDNENKKIFFPLLTPLQPRGDGHGYNNAINVAVTLANGSGTISLIFEVEHVEKSSPKQ